MTASLSVRPGRPGATGGSPAGAAAALALAFVLAAVEATAAGMLPHRATYRITQHDVAHDSSVSSIRGRLELSFEKSCDGWRLEQHIGLLIHDERGTAREHLSSLQGWETHGGGAYTFTLRGFEDRREVEHLAGSARLSPGTPQADFARPSETAVALDPDTLFPMGHIEALMAAARAGQRRHLARVFDGTTEGPGFEVSTLIGKPVEAPRPEGVELDAVTAWPMRLAFFEIGDPGPTAVFEMSLTLLDDGIATDLVYDYGDFSMAVALRSLERLPEPSC